MEFSLRVGTDSNRMLIHLLSWESNIQRDVNRQDEQGPNAKWISGLPQPFL